MVCKSLRQLNAKCAIVAVATCSAIYCMLETTCARLGDNLEANLIEMRPCGSQLPLRQHVQYFVVPYSSC